MIRPELDQSASTQRRRRRNRRRARLHPARMAKVVPSLLTLGNLLCGFAAIFYASRPFVWDDQSTYVLGHWDPFSFAAGLIFLGMLFDALDGRIARMTRQTTELGEQLDSMADMVTFGVAPAFALVELIDIGTPFFGTPELDTFFDRAVLISAAVYVACCALRLARFNIEVDEPSEQSHQFFKGLPSPAAAGAIAGLLILHQSLLGDHPGVAQLTGAGLVCIAALVAVAMVSTIRYSHAMTRYLRGRAPFHYIATAAVVVPALLLVPETLALAFVVYALSGPAGAAYRKLHARRGGDQPAGSPTAEREQTKASAETPAASRP